MTTEIEKLKDELDEALDRVKELEDENTDLNDKIKSLEEDIDDLQNQLDEREDYSNNFEGIETIEWNATNFTDKELMEALQECCERKVNIRTIIGVLNALK